MRTERELKVFSKANMLIIIILGILYKMIPFQAFRDIFIGPMAIVGFIQFLACVFIICLRMKRHATMEHNIRMITLDSLARAQESVIYLKVSHINNIII
jgi:hypothetical protein